ncbi:MAG: UDP-N-acetylmuramoyl-L-alanyl-D-glutamate--2,6-diaminopimelate ligase, partial [Lachnospiraceae bacterium]|nr:UDP-N-acetylmuramoyl-L-alanyl-D-glutamate--2,6-diaminopimelate ligase [Lachnospiraceae bacterium]
MFYLKELLKKLSYEVIRGSDEVYVKDIVNDSRKVSEGSLFFCISGANFDGHEFAAEVSEKGASVLITEREVELPDEALVTVIRV